MVRTLLGSLCALLALVPAAHADWTAPAPLSGCPAAATGSGHAFGGAGQRVTAAAPLIVYPSSEPQVRSGAGALLWSAAGRCAGGAQGVFAASLGASGLPGGSAPAVALAALSAAVGTTAGQVLALGTTTAGTGAFVEGGLAGTFSTARPLGGPAEPVAAVSGYLGDAVLVSLKKGPPHARGTLTNPPRAHVRGAANPSRVRARAAGSAKEVPKRAPWTLAVRVQRHYDSVPQPPRVLPLGSAPPDALAVAMDFRSDLLLVWAAQGAIYARELYQGGAAGPVRRLAGVAGVPELRALFSDDGRAIVAWRGQRGSNTSILISISDATLRFGAPRTVERFTDLSAVAPPPGSLRLARLSSEAVMMAWTGMRAGRYVVRASPVSLRRGVWAPIVISAPPASTGSPTLLGRPGLPVSSRVAGGSRPTQALLADLVSGPRAEVLALWSTAPLARGGQLDGRRRAIAAAWGHYGGHGEARFASPETISAPGANGTPAAAFDPQNDRALAAWVTGSGSSAQRIAYAQRSVGPPTGVAVAARPYRPVSAVRRAGRAPATERGVRPVWLSAIGLLLFATAAAVRQLSARRRGIRGPRGPARWEGRVRVPRERARRPRSRRQ